MGRFYILDPSLRHVGGHYLEYAIHVAEAASRAGYEPWILPHLQIEPGAREQFAARQVLPPEHVVPTFRHDHTIRGDEFWFLRIAKRSLAAIGSLGQAARRAMPQRRATVNTEAPQPSSRRRTGTLGNVLREAVSAFTSNVKRGHIVADLRRALGSRQFTSDDIVFVPTLSPVELDAIGRFIRGHSTAKLATWHFVFRYNLFQGREPDYAPQIERCRWLQKLFARFKSGTAPARVTLYCDTVELVRQFDALGVFAFQVLPIPHAFSPSDDGTTRGPLQIVYLGDARTEKGYLRLPGLVAAVAKPYLESGKARFRLQSNFNLAHGEPGIPSARETLASYPAEQVEVLRHTMSSEAYREFLHDGDISLILYDADIYYARSSGVFAESVAAGMPVLVTGGTWAAAQLQAAIAEHHAQLSESTECLKAEAFAPSPARSISLTLTPDASASFLLGRVVIDRAQPGEYVKVALACHCEVVLHRQSALIGPLSTSGEYTWVLPLQQRASKLEVVLSNAFQPDDPAPFQRLIIEQRRAPGVIATSAAGIVIADFADLPDLLAELIDHYDHYRQTVRVFSQTFLDFHNPDKLVAGLQCGSSCVPSSLQPELNPA